MGDAFRLLIGFLAGIGLVGALIAYLLLMPERAERVAGWVFGITAICIQSLDRAAVAYKVQGAVNSMRAEWQENAPDLLEKKLRVKWASVDEAEAQLRDGEVLVVMQRARNTDENVAHAVMAYLPKALLSRARPYLDKERMRAADLVIAKSLFAHNESNGGASDVFYEKHLGPARAESAEIRKKIEEMDGIDLEGWLTRILLAEYQILGRQLYPGEPDVACVRDGEQFARWLHSLSTRKPGDKTGSLTYRGRYFRIAVILVARKDLLERRGLAPYRRRAKRYLYRDKMDAVYIMGRDETIAPVQALGDALEGDARVASVTRYVYPLRGDFKKRKLNRDHAAVVCLRRRQMSNDDTMGDAEEDDSDLRDEAYTPSL